MQVATKEQDGDKWHVVASEDNLSPNQYLILLIASTMDNSNDGEYNFITLRLVVTPTLILFAMGWCWLVEYFCPSSVYLVMAISDRPAGQNMA